MASTPTEQNHDPQFREIDMSAEMKKAWGPKWNAPNPSYEFSQGRKFELKTGDAAIYVSSPDF